MSRGNGRIYRRPGSRNWWLDYSHAGTQHRESSHTTDRQVALNLLSERVPARRKGTLTGHPDKLTFADLRAGLDAQYRAKANRSWPRAVQAFTHLEAYFSATSRALAITKSRVAQYVAQRLATGAKQATVAYEVAILNAAFAVAVENGALAMAPRFKRPAVSNARQGFLERADMAALLMELPEPERAIVEFLHGSGWRVSEAHGLVWAMIEWDDQAPEGAPEPVPGPHACIRLPRELTKAKRTRQFPFAACPPLVALLLARWRVRDGLHVFHTGGQPITSLRAVWTHATKRAGLAGKLIHDLRRTAARDFLRAGVSQPVVKQLVGWASDQMFARYAIVVEADLAAGAAQRFNSTAPSTAPAQPPAGHPA